MKQHIRLSGLTCDACVAKVTTLLKLHPQITQLTINESRNMAIIETETPLHQDELMELIKDFPKYTIEGVLTPGQLIDNSADYTPWLVKYKPIWLIFGFIILVSSLTATDGMSWMRCFMAGFFLCFSFFKLLDLKGFAMNYREYDIVAKHWNSWGNIYPFLELGLGIAFLANFFPFYTNIFTLFLMSISLPGVIGSVLRKEEIRCACLGNLFNLPMSTVTIIENLVMAAMSGYMVVSLF